MKETIALCLTELFNPKNPFRQLILLEKPPAEAYLSYRVAEHFSNKALKVRIYIEVATSSFSRLRMRLSLWHFSALDECL